ncbi:O-antigen ligase family protein [Winogradskyella poriferorum]|uniref:O-antigen ligase family protein n=1 Tax=Winogradskyella poriferorum TaxID=307627 RepID=UPI003D64E478
MSVKLYLDKAVYILVFLVTFSLPFDYNYNNWVLGVLYSVSIILIVLNRKKVEINNGELLYILLISGFFLLTFFGIFYSENIDKATALLVRTLPMCLTPFVFFSIPEFYVKYTKSLCSGLVFGCLLAVILCWSNVIVQMLINNEPFSYLFRWRHLNHQLTGVIGIHPTYLALFVVTSIVILIYNINLGIDKKEKYASKILILIFSLFLFALLARTILSFYIFSVFLFFVIKRKTKILFYSLLFITMSIVVVFSIKDENNYLRNKLFNDLPVLGSENRQDLRFNRLQATKYMFLEHPFFGVGTGDTQEYRQKHYLEQNDTVAYKRKFNAHNQFFEYLDSFGVLGGGFYLFFFTFLLIKTIKQKDYAMCYILILFFVANLTESMLVRTHGVVYYSLAFSLLCMKNYHTEGLNKTL